MPQRKILSIKKASAALKIEPMLFKLRTSSRIKIKGVFGACLKSVTDLRISSLFFSFRMFIKLVNNRRYCAC